MRPQKPAKDEVEGSRPRVWKPARNPRAPPGGHTSIQPAKYESYGHFGQSDGFPGAAGGNGNPKASDGMRFHREEERLGKQSGPKAKPAADKHARDMHRYYTATDDRPEQVHGRSHGSSKTKRQSILGLNDVNLVSQMTPAFAHDDNLSEADSLPLGAEWSCF